MNKPIDAPDFEALSDESKIDEDAMFADLKKKKKKKKDIPMDLVRT